VALVFVLCVALGRLGMADSAYRKAQQEFAQAVQKRLPPKLRPIWHRGKNDPPGVQRWVFPGRALFESQTQRDSALNSPPRLTAGGKRALRLFALLLKEHREKWRRIRVEGHTRPPMKLMSDDWELSSARAAVVSRRIVSDSRTPPWFLAVAGRAGQNPAVKVLLFYRAGDPKAAEIMQSLTDLEVSYSSKNILQDHDARRELSRRGLSRTPVIVTRLMNGREIVTQDVDKAAVRGIGKLFPENDRVEVLVEYSRKSIAHAPTDSAW